MILSLIVAIGADDSIGKDGDLLWHLPGDLKRFKTTTTGHPIIMGRKTFLSLPKGALPHRRNMVISTTLPPREGIEVFASIEEALREVETEEEVFIIGGATLYEVTLPYADRLYLTRVHASFPDADTFFPEIDFTEWCPKHQETFPKDEKNAYQTVLTIYDRLPYFKKS